MTSAGVRFWPEAAVSSDSHVAARTLLRSVLRTMTVVAGADKGFIFKRQSGELTPIVGVDLAGGREVETAVPSLPAAIVTRSIRAGRLVEFGAPSVRPSARRTVRVDRSGRENTALCIPLVENASVAGLVCVERLKRRGGFTREQRRVLTLLGRQAASTLEAIDRHDDELKAVRSNMNPHFLHNTLSVIAEFVRVDAAKAEDAVLMLSRLYRYVVESSAERIVTLAQEVAMSRDYLTLEQHRLGERMQTAFIVDGPVDDIHVPCLLLQKVVENSVTYGMADKVGAGRVRVRVSVNGARCRLSVQDDGPDWIDRAKRSEPGLRHVLQRLSRHYPSSHSFRISGRGGVRIDIEILRRHRVEATRS